MTLSWWTLTKSEAAKREAKYQLAFKPAALAEWNALDGSVKELFRSVLKKRLGSPPPRARAPVFWLEAVKRAEPLFFCHRHSRISSASQMMGNVYHFGGTIPTVTLRFLSFPS